MNNNRYIKQTYKHNHFSCDTHKYYIDEHEIVLEVYRNLDGSVDFLCLYVPRFYLMHEQFYLTEETRKVSDTFVNTADFTAYIDGKYRVIKHIYITE